MRSGIIFLHPSLGGYQTPSVSRRHAIEALGSASVTLPAPWRKDDDDGFPPPTTQLPIPVQPHV